MKMQINNFQSFSCLFLLTFITACSQIIRIPIEKASIQESNPMTHFRNLDLKTISLDIYNVVNFHYTGCIKVGPTSQPFKVILDTGSSPLWVRDSSISDNIHATYDCSSSQACRAFPDSEYNIKYGKGNVMGYKASEQIHIGEIKIPYFDMILAKQVEDFRRSDFDGILGLSLGRYIPELPTLLEVLKKNKLIESASFSMYLGDDPKSSGRATGEIIFGGYDPSYAKEEFKFVDIYSSYDTLFWAAPLTFVMFGTDRLTRLKTLSAIFDSGTSLFVIPESIIRDFLEKATKLGINFEFDSNVGLYKCDCKAGYTLDDLVFGLKGVNLTVSASSYIFSRSGSCYLGFRSDEKMHDKIILGDALLKHYYVFYNADNSTIGFAPAVSTWVMPDFRLLYMIVIGVIMVIATIIYKCYWKKNNNPQIQASTFRSKGVIIGGSYTELQPPQGQEQQNVFDSRASSSTQDRNLVTEDDSSQSYFNKLKSKGVMIGSDLEKRNPREEDNQKENKRDYLSRDSHQDKSESVERSQDE